MFYKSIEKLASRGIDSRDIKYLLSILVASLLVKLAFILQNEIINPDGVRYLNSSYELFQGNVAEAFYHDRNLVFTGVLGLFNLIIPNGFMAGKVMSCFFLLLTTIPIYFITRELFGRMAAIAAGLVFTFLDSIHEMSISVVREPPFILFFLLAVWFALLAIKNRNLSFFAVVGLLVFMAGLFRLEALLIYPILYLYLLWLARKDPELRFFFGKGILALSALPLFLLGIVLVACMFDTGAYAVLEKLYTRFHNHYVAEDFFVLYQAVYEFLKANEMSVTGGINPQDFFEIARHNLYLVYLIGLIEKFLSSLSPLYILPFFYGLDFKNKLKRDTLLILIVLSVYLLCGYFFLLMRNYITSRYVFVPVVLSIPFIAHGLERFAGLLKCRRYGPAFVVIAFSIILLLPTARSFEKLFDEKTVIKTAGEWLASEGLIANRILTNDERIPFYAGLYRDDYTQMFLEEIESLPGKNFSEIKKYDVITLLSSSKKSISENQSFNGFQMVKTIGDDDELIWIYKNVN